MILKIRELFIRKVCNLFLATVLLEKLNGDMFMPERERERKRDYTVNKLFGDEVLIHYVTI